MRILVYGFEPYGKYSSNISQDIIRQLDERRGQVIPSIFPVSFDKEQIIHVVEKERPDVILGLGQYSKGKKIRIEQRAKNAFGGKSDIKEKIDPTGPDLIATFFSLPSNQDCELSDNAGTFVCNFSMYVIGKMAEARGIPFSFLHIPKDFNKGQAVAIVEKAIDKLLSS